MSFERSNSSRPGRFRKWPCGLFLLTILAAVLVLPALPEGPPHARTIEELPAGPMQVKATAACAECHEPRIIVQQRLTKAAWTKEVDKMIKWGALVESADHDALVDYLSANFGADQPPYEAPRSALAKVESKKKAK